MTAKQAPRRDGSTGGGHKPWFALHEEREPFIKRSLDDGPGYRERVSPKSGWTIIELYIQCDPRKDTAWADEMRATIGEQRFQREYCIRSTSLVLCHDLSWRRAGDLVVGEDLVGFDEHLGGYFKYRRSRVQSKKTVQARAVKIYTDRASTTVSEHHQFVVSNARRGCGHAWKAARDLMPGDRILYFGQPWEPEESRKAGWLAGLFDGEGHIAVNEVSVAQNPGPVLEAAREGLESRGYNVFGGNPNGGKCCSLRISQRYDRMRLLGTLRPIRLLAQSDKTWNGGACVMRNGVNRYAVVRRTTTDSKPSSFLAIQTSTRTLIADGFFSHNCHNWALSTQSPYYPEYLAQGGDEFFVREIATLGRGPLLMALDFGVRHPALLVGQANARKTRLYLIREWMPTGIQARPFLEVCCWLVGQMPREELGSAALVHVLDLERRADEGKGPAVPWIKDPGQVLRYSSQEALRTAQEVTAESRERRIVDIWEAAGFPLNVHHAAVRGGGDVVRHLLRKPPKGVMPYLVVDKWCQITKEGLGGGYTFKRATRQDPMPAEPIKDGHYEHLQDDLKYMASQAIDMKAADDGTPDGKADSDNPVVDQTQNARTRRPDPAVYSRNEGEDLTVGCSSPWAVPESNDVYNREDY